MIATGGTIASKSTNRGLAPALTADDLLSSVPEIREVCSVQEVQPFNIDSTNVYSRHWLEIAKIVESSYNEFDGFVITHGRAVDRNFFAHVPSGMRERVLCSNLFKLRRGKFKKGSAACC